MLKADKDDRAYISEPPRGGGWFFLVILFLFAAAAGAYFYLGKDKILSFFMTHDAEQSKQLSMLYQKWGIEPLPEEVLANSNIRRRLDILMREPCDWQVVWPLNEDLQSADYRRHAANVLVGFSRNCMPSSVALHSASDILLGLGDLDGALKISEELVAMAGEFPQYQFTRAKILEAAGRNKEAVDAFYSTIGLTDDPATLNILSFTGIASNQAVLGNFCDAIEPLQIWLSIDPSNRDTPRLRKMMDDYASKGKCEGVHARGKARFPVTGNNVISANVEINGVRGRFIVDTGASFVAVTSEFASKADLKLSGDYPLTMQTANGVSKAQRATIETIEVGAVSARDVAAVVLQGGPSTLGAGTDGLLGRSFLSRFNVTFGKREWNISAK